jgi:hypothetical protein
MMATGRDMLTETEMIPPVGGWKVGNVVTRPVNVFKAGSPIRVGTVSRRYADEDHDELYEVVWTSVGGRLIKPLWCQGYLRHGLDGGVLITGVVCDEHAKEIP